MTAAAAMIISCAVVRPASAEDIKIGFIGPLSGPAANVGLAMRQGINLAFKKANAAGPVMIDGHPSQLIPLFEDSQSKPAIGVASAQLLLTRDKVSVLVGDLFHSDVTLALMELAPTTPDFMMSAGPTSGEISRRIAADPVKFKNFWKPWYNNAQYGGTLLGTVEDLITKGSLAAGDKTVAFIIEDVDSQRDLSMQVGKLFTANGWKVTTVEALPVGASDYYPQLSKLRRAPPTVLISASTTATSGAALVKQIQELGLESLHFAIFYPAFPPFRAAAGAAADGLLWMPLFFDPLRNPVHKAFAAEIAQGGGSPPTADTAIGYCIASVLLDNIKRAGSVDADTLSKAFATTNYPCVIGRWKFNLPDHTAIPGPDGIPLPAAQIRGTDNITVWPAAAATGSYQKPAQ